jgi:putative ABC transport system permease protein
MAVIARSLERLHPRENKDLALGMAPAATWMVGTGDRSLLLLMGAVGVVLLIACANVANLLLGRASARQREMAVRAAIGAGRGRLIRQLLTESLLLSVAGGCLGLVLAYGTVNALPHILPEKVFRLEEANVDLSVLVFTLTVSIVTGILFGLAPALASARTDVIHALKAAGHTVSHARRGSRLRNALVVVQIALSLVLLAGAGLLLNTLWRLQSVHLGFRPDNVYVISCTLPPTAPYVTDLGFKRVAPANPTVRRHYAPENAAKVFAERVVENLKKVPGVNSAGAAVFASPFISSNRTPFRLETQPSLTPEQSSRQMANVAGITEDYLEVLGIPVLHGRGIQRSDRGGLPVAIVSNALARSIWGDSQAAIGQRIALDSNTLFEIVGVVGDVRQWAVPRNGEYIYVPEWHIWEPTYVELTLPFRFTSYFLVSTRTDINQLRPLLQKSIREIEPGQPVEEIKAVPELIATAFGPWRSYVSLLAGFAVVALLLSAVGVYGVISYNVAKRTQEIGLRMALGATPKDILRLIITRGFYLAMAGIVVGAVAAYWLTQVIETLLYGVKRTDPVTFTCVAMVLLATALFACYLPARHAAQLNPATSLRSE